MFRIFKFAGLAVVAAVFLSVGAVQAEAATPTVYLFHGDGCPHCAEEWEFLDKLKKEKSDLVIRDFEVWYHPENINFLRQVADITGVPVTGVPLTIVGDRFIAGFNTAETTGVLLRELIESYEEGKREYRDIVGGIEAGTITKAILEKEWVERNGENVEGGVVGASEEREGVIKPCVSGDDECGLEAAGVSNLEHGFGGGLEGKKVELPWFGEIDLGKTTLVAFTVLVAGLDGFNPCAMWVLLFLIGMLFGIKDRRKMWILGIAFLVASAFVYFLFMAVWLNLLLFLGFVIWVRALIGILALGGGALNLREWWNSRPGVCEVTQGDSKQKIFERLRNFIEGRNFWIALGGVILLAFAVNLVELVCSAGLPAVYTGVLSAANLAGWEYYAYLLLYIFIFMLDDMIVFAVAMMTLKVTGLSGKYAHLSHLWGGIIMLLLGLLLLFRPEWVMFNF